MRLAALARCSVPRVAPDHRALDRRPGHRRRPARAVRTARRAGRAQPRRSCGTPPGRHRRSSAASASWPTTCRHAPGVYLFRGRARARCSTSARRADLRQRVRIVLLRAETRQRIKRDGRAGRTGRPRRVRTALEAQVREQRLIAQPPAAVQPALPQTRAVRWVKLTDEPFPRLSIVRGVRADEGHAASARSLEAAARLAVEALQDAVPIRQCTRAPASARVPIRQPCALAELGRCGAPCAGARAIDDLRRPRRLQCDDAGRRATARAVVNDAATPHRIAGQRRCVRGRGRPRDRLAALVRGGSTAAAAVGARRHRRAGRRRPDAHGGWELAVVRLRPARRRRHVAPARRRPEPGRRDGRVRRDRAYPAPGPAAAARQRRGDRPCCPALARRRASRPGRRSTAVVQPGLRGVTARWPASRVQALRTCAIGHPSRDRRPIGGEPPRPTAGSIGPARASSLPHGVEFAAMMTAIVLIDARPTGSPRPPRQIADLPGVDQVYSCRRRRRPGRDRPGAPTTRRSPTSSRADSKVAGVLRDRHPHRVPRRTRSTTSTTRSRSASS